MYFLLDLPEVTQESINEFKNLGEVHAGHNVKLTCRAKGEPKTGYYVWRWENGTVIQNETSGVLEFRNIQPYQGGRLSCAGGSYIGEGDKAYVNVDVRGEVAHQTFLIDLQWVGVFDHVDVRGEVAQTFLIDSQWVGVFDHVDVRGEVTCYPNQVCTLFERKDVSKFILRRSLRLGNFHLTLKTKYVNPG